MKNIFKLIPTIILLFNIGLVFGQSSSVDYKLESQSVQVSGLDVAVFSTINKIGNTLEWKQEVSGNISSTSFQITDTSGHWNQNMSKGSLNYTVAKDGYQGTFTLEGADNGIIASLSLKREDKEELFIFKINEITYL